MRSHQPKERVSSRLVGAIHLKLALVALVALLLVALPQIFSARAGASPRTPQGFLFTVTTTADHNDFVCDGSDCTLREAIQAANNIPTEDTIDFAVTGVINLASALPDISGSVAIEGPGAELLTVRRDDSAAQFRIFNVTTTGTVSFSGLTISNGIALVVGGIFNASTGTVNVTNSTITNNSAEGGGGIHNNFRGTVNVTNSTISNNLANGVGGIGIINDIGAMNITNSTISSNDGGGIQNGTGTVNVTNSTISNNDGIGILNDPGTVTITNSTISKNHNDAGSGGGVLNVRGTVNLTNSTLTGNSAGVSGGGIYSFNVNSTVNVKNSIVALNTAGEFFPDAGGLFSSAGFNLIGKTDGSTGFIAPTDLTGTIASPLDPLLDPNGLQDNGGPTKTIALLCGSPAIDKGTSMGLTGNLTTDQRGTGFPRTLDDPLFPNASGGDGTDIGAFELQEICNHPPVAQCRNIQVSANNNCQATVTAAQIDNGSFDPDPGDSIASRSLDNSGPFGLGQHTVTLTVTDTHGVMSSCMATVTVVDTTPPTITCPANIIIKTTDPGNSTVVVNYPSPSASDNCPGVMVACSPPSGSQFPLGATTVNCTATDAATNKATCSFVVTVFDVCVQDDTRRDTLLFNSQTGDYLFVKCGAGGFSLSGRGIVRVQGSIFTLEHNASDRRVLATLDNSIKRGTASVQYFPLGTTFTITDRNTSDNTCACP